MTADFDIELFIKYVQLYRLYFQVLHKYNTSVTNISNICLLLHSLDYEM